MIDFNNDEEKEIAAFTKNESLAEKVSKREKQEISTFRELLSWLLWLGFAIIVALFIRRFCIINATVTSGSMENTIMTGDKLIGNRLAYLKDTPERGDIIIFKYPDDESKKYVKRVIGLPGEIVTIIDSKIYINNSTIPLDESYLKEEWVNANGPFTYEVPEACYFVMGDNRNDSWDARYWTNTYVEEDKIFGKAVFRYWPLNEWKKL